MAAILQKTFPNAFSWMKNAYIFIQIFTEIPNYEIDVF